MSSQPRSTGPHHAGFSAAPEPAQERRALHHGGRHLLMMLMCVPMLLFLGALVLTGRAGAGSFLGALLCVGMVAAMMGMHGGHDRR